MTPDPQDTVTWHRITFEDLADIKKGSPLAQKILQAATAYLSDWRPAYINAVERLVINPEMMVDEDTVISEPTTLDGEDGAYVLCWQFVPHSAVIPPSPSHTTRQLNNDLDRLRVIGNALME